MLNSIKRIKTQLISLRSRLTRIVSIGEMSDVDATSHRVKVILKGLDSVKTDWLPVLTIRSLGVSAVHNMEAGEQVLCLFPPFGDMANGVVIGAMYNSEDKPAFDSCDVFGFRFKDGTIVKYDQSKNELILQICGGEPSLTLNKSGLQIVGNVEIQGDILASGRVSDGSGSMTDIRTRYNGHTHTTPHGMSGKPNIQMKKRAARHSKAF